MADQFNGRFKLESCKNCTEFYKAINMPQAEIEKYSYMEDPGKNIEFETTIENGQIASKFFVGGDQVHEDKAKLGETRDSQFEEVKYTTTTTLEGNKIVDETKRAGQKDARYERTIKGNKLIVEMSSQGVAVKGVKEFIRV